MARSLSANFGVAVAREASLGVLPGSPVWLTLQPNSIGKIGAELSTVVRQPMSKNRMEDKGEVVDLNSGFEYETDLTMDAFLAFIEAFMMASWTGPSVFTEDTIRVSAVTATDYTVASGGALTAGWLIYARGFLNAANNGLKVVAAASTSTAIKASGLVAEAAIPVSRNVSVEVAGVQGAAGDIQMNSSGNLTSTLLDFTTLGLTVGQTIKIGGSDAATQFANVTANNGYARVAIIAANLLTLDWRSATFNTDDGATKTIQLLYGQFLRNVPADHADELRTRSFQFEAAYEDLSAVGVDAYEYPAGNMANELTFNLPLTDKATMRVGFVGTDTPDPTTSRATGASTARQPVRTAMFNTVTEFIRLSLNNVDESGLSTDFKSAAISLKQNVAGERVLGTLGAKYINFGIFVGMLDATVLFTDPAIAAAVRAHTTLALKVGLKNSDGGFFLDIPACTLDSGKKDFPTFQSITIQTPVHAHRDPVLGYVMSFSHFPYLP